MEQLLIQINDTIFTLIFSVVGSLMLILTGIIGYFLKKFSEQVNLLTSVVHDIQLILAGNEEKQKAYWKACEVRHGLNDEKIKHIDFKLDSFGNKIAEHDVDIKLLKKK